jgi:catechol 2,3-dioxygenase-like lactoylglutathione lyase family enzyme
LEHANLSVADVDGVIAFLRTAFPEFRIRHDSRGEGGPRWVHVGTEETYIALQVATTEPEAIRLRRGRPLNHLGYEVDDVHGVRDRLTRAGYEENRQVPNAHPFRKRVYFWDGDGNEWEFVEYLSADPADRNDYESPDV